MKTFFQVLLGMLFAVLGFLGNCIAILSFNVSWRFPWQFFVGIAVFCFAIHAVTRVGRTRWVKFPAFGLLAGSAVLAGALTYGRIVPTLWFLVVTAVLSLLAFMTVYGRPLKLVSAVWLMFFALSSAMFVADHGVFYGGLFAWKWRVIEHPIFTPYEIRPAERHGRKAIYVFDWNGPDPASVALVWGWSLYPKFVDLEEARPEGSLLNSSKIQEAIR